MILLVIRIVAIVWLLAIAPLPLRAQVLRPDEISAPANDDAAIKALLRDALDIQAKQAPTVAELDKEIDYFQQILDIKSDHAVAWDGLNRARAQKQALLDKQTDDGKKKGAGATAARKSEDAFLAGDVVTAQNELDKARAADPDNPLVVRMAGRIKDEFIRQQRQRLAMLLTGGVVLLALIVGAWRWLRVPRIPWIEVLDGSDNRIQLSKDIMRVGSVAGEGDRRNDIVLADPEGMLSRYHCEFRTKQNRLYVVDCGSRNGTMVDGRRVPPQRLVPLRDGSTIALAMSHELRLVFERKR